MIAVADKENYNCNALTEVKTHGAIVRIVFHNFLTYDDVICSPGSYLNVIIGPNGTGKSTIICGICLAVGGLPKVLGRSDQYGDFVKHGKETGFVELHMYDENKKGVRIFKITLHRPNSSRYYIDGHQVTRDEHCRNIREYNIQVDNPCTFLAQDKVKSFAEQDPKQLLKNTEKAGPESLTRMHNNLEAFFEEGEAIRNQIAEKHKRFDTLKQNMQTLKMRAENFNEREKHHFKISLLKKRKALMEYDREVELRKAKTTALKKAESARNKAREAMAPLNDRINVAQKAAENSENVARQMQSKLNEHTREIESSAGTEAFEEALTNNASTFALVRKQYDNWESEKAKIAEELENITILCERAKAENNEPNEEFETRRVNLMEAYQNLKILDREIRMKRNELVARKEELQKHVEGQQQKFNAKLQTIAQVTRNHSIIEAWECYERRRNEFRFPVFIPYLHLEVINHRHLIYLNNTVGKRDLAMFIFGCKEDEERLMVDNRFRINSTVVDSALCDKYCDPSILPQSLQQLGFTEFLSELFNAPLPVRAYLCSVKQLDRIPIGGEEVDASCEKIAKQIGKHYSLFLTSQSRISVVFSKYTEALYIKRSALHNGLILSRDHSQRLYDYSEEFQKMQDDMNENAELIKQHENNKRELEERLSLFRQEEKAIAEKRNQVTVLEDKVKRFQRRLQEYSKEKPNVDVAASAFEEKKRVLVAQAIRDLSKLVNVVESQRMCMIDAALANAEKERQRRILFQLRSELVNLETSYRECECEYELKKQALDVMSDLICVKKRAFLQIFSQHPENNERPEFSSKEKAFLRDLEREFDVYKIPNDADAIDQQISDEYNRLEIGRNDGSRQDVVDYEQIVAEFEKIQREICQEQNKNDQWSELMDERLAEWLNPLKILVERINDNYSRFFNHLGCAGSVELKEADDKYNIKEYGIIISVKFRRDTQLRPLTHQTQSGGERSVATMLYLMALQDLCPVPFRCVDEINQGMDPNNERMVFNMMVRLLSASGEVAKTQYFLLTPKLLSGLEFNDRVTVHVVHNGPTMKNAEAWNPDKFLRLLA